MEAKYVDPKTGEEKHYEISYSQELQQKTIDALEKNNKLVVRSNRIKWVLLVALIIVVIVGMLIWSGTGTIGDIIRRGVCP